MNALNESRIRYISKLFGDEFDFKDIEFFVKIRDTYKTGKKNSIGISGLSRNIQSTCQEICWFIINRRKW